VKVILWEERSEVVLQSANILGGVGQFQTDGIFRDEPVSCCERTKTQIPFEQRPKIQQEVPLLPVQTGRNLRRGALFLVFNMRTDENSDSFEQRPKIF